MTTFDGSTHRTPDPAWTPPAAGPTPKPDADVVIDTLDLLRGELESRQSSEFEPTVVTVPGGTIRLVCTADIGSRQVTNWQRKALSPQARKRAQVSPLEVDQVTFNSAVLISTCERIEVWRPDTEQWAAIAAGDGTLLGFGDRALLDTFKVVDATAAIKKLFPRDIDLIKAGQDVLRGAGWADQDGDADEDPS